MGLHGMPEVRPRDAHTSLSATESRCRDLNPDRIFPYQIINTNNNAVEACLNQCAAFGYPAGGMEFGDECCKRDQSQVSLGFTADPDSQIVATWRTRLVARLILIQCVLLPALETRSISVVVYSVCRQVYIVGVLHRI